MVGRCLVSLEAREFRNFPQSLEPSRKHVIDRESLYKRDALLHTFPFLCFFSCFRIHLDDTPSAAICFVQPTSCPKISSVELRYASELEETSSAARLPLDLFSLANYLSSGHVLGLSDTMRNLPADLVGFRDSAWGHNTRRAMP